MKKVLLILFISIIGMNAYSQSAREKKAAQTDLDNLKRLYGRLKEYKIDTKTELVWEYTYQDSTEAQLKNLAAAFEKGELKTKELVQSPKSKKIYLLTVTEIKKYSKPEELNERVNHLNEVALVYKITMPYAAVSAEKPEKEGEIGSYKKVGVGKNKKKE